MQDTVFHWRSSTISGHSIRRNESMTSVIIYILYKMTISVRTSLSNLFLSLPTTVWQKGRLWSYSLSDHYSVCFSRKINYKISKNEHTTATYRYFKTCYEAQFLHDLDADMAPFKILMSESDEDCTAWYSAIKKQLDSIDN